MGTRSFDFLTQSLLFNHDYLDNDFENVSQATLRKTLNEYREFCDENTHILRSELAKTHLTVFPGLRRSTDLKSITQSAFYLDQYLLDDPLYRLSIPERPMNALMRKQIGMSPRVDLRRAVSRAARHMKRHTPFVAANYVKFLPLTRPQEPTVPIRYSKTFFSDALPKSLMRFFHERVRVQELVPVADGLLVIEEPLRPTRRICVTFGDDERSGIYVLQEAEIKKFDEETGLVECIHHLPDAPPDPSRFNAWVFQSINQTARQCYEELLRDVTIATDLDAQYVTTTRLDFELLQENLLRQEPMMNTNYIPVDLTVIKDIDPNTLMRIRQEESSAFQSFRNNLNKRLSEIQTTSDIEARERRANDVVRELKEEGEALSSVIRQLRKRAILDSTIATGTLVAAVQSSGFTVLTLILALLNGVRTWEEYKTQVRMNPAFFLWKLQSQQ